MRTWLLVMMAALFAEGCNCGSGMQQMTGGGSATSGGTSGSTGGGAAGGSVAGGAAGGGVAGGASAGGAAGGSTGGGSVAGGAAGGSVAGGTAGGSTAGGVAGGSVAGGAAGGSVGGGSAGGSAMAGGTSGGASAGGSGGGAAGGAVAGGASGGGTPGTDGGVDIGCAVVRPIRHDAGTQDGLCPSPLEVGAVPALVFGDNRTGLDTQVTCNYGVAASERNYRFTVPTAGELTIDLTNLSQDAGFKPTLGVYTGCDFAMQFPQGCLPSHPLSPVTHLVIPAIDAGTYVLAVDGFDLAMGDFSLAMCLRPTPVSAAGDSCTNPAPLAVTNQHAYVEGNSLGMADDAHLIQDNAVPCFGDVDRVWVLDLPDAGPGGLWDVHPRAWPLTDEFFAPSLALTRDCPAGSPVIDGGVLACGVGMGPLAGHPFGASFAQHLPAGRHYLWLQGTESVAPRMPQAWALDVTYARVGSVANDACSMTAPLLAPNATYAGTLVGATDTLSAVTCADMSGQNGSGADVFYRYVAPATGMATFELIGEVTSAFYVGLFTGCSPTSCLTMVNPNGTQNQTRFTAPVVQGTTYYLMVEEYDSTTMPSPSIAYGWRGGFSISVSQ